MGGKASKEETNEMTSKNDDEEKKSNIKDVDEANLICPICLEECSFPVELGCTHIFCYLCVKGQILKQQPCPLCRKEIPWHILTKPQLLPMKPPSSNTEREYYWFYQGKNGWWKYDLKTNDDIEQNFGTVNMFKVAICGSLYVIDFDRMVQYNSSNQTKRRKIRRELASSIEAKGIAGLPDSMINYSLIPSDKEETDSCTNKDECSASGIKEESSSDHERSSEKDPIFTDVITKTEIKDDESDTVVLPPYNLNTSSKPNVIKRECVESIIDNDEVLQLSDDEFDEVIASASRNNKRQSSQ